MYKPMNCFILTGVKGLNSGYTPPGTPAFDNIVLVFVFIVHFAKVTIVHGSDALCFSGRRASIQSDGAENLVS